MLHLLKKYSPKHDKYVTLKNNLVDNASKFYDGREKIIEGFKNGVFSFYYDRDYEERMKYEKEEEEETITNIDEFSKYITKNETDINNELSKNHFGFQKPSDIFKALNNINDIEKSNELVSMISSELKDLKEDIIKMSKQKKIEKPDKIVEIVKEILKFNKKKNN